MSGGQFMPSGQITRRKAQFIGTANVPSLQGDGGRENNCKKTVGIWRRLCYNEEK